MEPPLRKAAPPEESDAYEPQEVKPFLEHLEDFRRTILQVLAVTGAGMVLTFPVAPWIMRLAMEPLARVVPDPTQFLRIRDPTGAIVMAMKLSLWGGLVLTLPISLAIIARFVVPGLTRRERLIFRRGLVLGTGSFLAGVIFCQFVVMPKALLVLIKAHEWMGVQPDWFANFYITFVLRLNVGFGLAFELPLILLLLVRLGVVTRAQLIAKRRHAIVVIFILAMLLTPPDPGSQIMMAVPLILLYEGCIFFARIVERRREADARRESA